MLWFLGAVSFTRFHTSPSTRVNVSLDQFRQGTTLVLKHHLGKCHVYDSFLHSSAPAVSWLTEELCLFSLLFIIWSFRSLFMDLGAKINFLSLLKAGGFYWPWNCMWIFLSKIIFLVISAFSNFLYSFILVSVVNVSPHRVLDFQKIYYLANLLTVHFRVPTFDQYISWFFYDVSNWLWFTG